MRILHSRDDNAGARSASAEPTPERRRDTRTAGTASVPVRHPHADSPGRTASGSIDEEQRRAIELAAVTGQITDRPACNFEARAAITRRAVLKGTGALIVAFTTGPIAGAQETGGPQSGGMSSQLP